MIGGTLALVEQGVLTREEATLSYRWASGTARLARNTCSRMWRAYGRTVHAQEFHGMDNIPRQGGALLIYYHGVRGHRCHIKSLKACQHIPILHAPPSTSPWTTARWWARPG